MASEIIVRANDPHPVLDANEISILQRFRTDPTRKDLLLQELDTVNQPSDQPGAKAQETSSAVGYIAAKAVAGEDVLDTGEVNALRDWFLQGQGP